MFSKYTFLFTILSLTFFCSYNLAFGAMVYDPNHTSTSTTTTSSIGDYFIVDSSGASWGVMGSPGNFTLTSLANRSRTVIARCQTLTSAITISATATVVEGSACTGTPVVEQPVTVTSYVAPTPVTTTTVVTSSPTPSTTQVQTTVTSTSVNTTAAPSSTTVPATPTTTNTYTPTYTTQTYTNTPLTTNGTSNPVRFSVCTTLYTNLYRGMWTNNNVRDLQYFLVEAGYLTVSPTGYFGLMTSSAVKRFQIDNSIEGTGFVGPLTRAMIKKVSCTN